MPENLIRSVFDQYWHVENRLTHGLVHVLASDEALTREFVRTIAQESAPQGGRLSFSCQLLPEQRDVEFEEPPEDRSIPDAWIYGETWALMIEAKVESALTAGQLRRHLSTARQKLGFAGAKVLAITADGSEPALLRGMPDVRWTSWPRVYKFLSSSRPFSHQLSRFLGQQFLQYIRAVEARGQAGDKILSTFAGVPVGADNRVSEREGRVAVRSLLRDLRPLLSESDMLPPLLSDDPQKRLTGPWDIICFDFSSPGQRTAHPHLSVGVWEREASIELILPNAAKTTYWKRLTNSTTDGLRDCLVEVHNRARTLSDGIEAVPQEPLIEFEILHRHFHGQTRQIVDGRLRFNVEALASSGGPVRTHAGWIPAVQDVLSQAGRVNLQVELLALYPYSLNSVSRTPEFARELVRAAEAMKPFLDLLLGQREAPGGIE